MACRATTTDAPSIPSPICEAVENWKYENIMLLTVLEPAMKAPSAPTHGATLGQALLNQLAALCASTIGMLGIAPAAAMSAEPELMNTCTIGTASNSAGAAAIIVPPERAQPRAKERKLMPKTAMQAIDTRIRIVPGE